MKRTKVIFPGEKLPYLKTAKPSIHLNDYVYHYFEVYLNNSSEEIARHTALPTLNTLLCINLNGPWRCSEACKETTIKSSTFFGHSLDTCQRNYSEGMHNFFISLKPGLAGLLLKSQPQDLENASIDLSYLFKDANLEEKFCEAHSFHERIELFERMFTQKFLSFESNYKYQTVQRGLKLLGERENLEQADMESLSRELAVSYSTLYRYFKEITGFSPKFCQKLDKFKKGLRQYKLHGYNFNHWEYGFTDFSHFAKVTKQLTARPPSEL